MSEIVYLREYPIRQRTNDCWDYMRNQIDWARISKEVHQKHVTYFDVSDCISIFPHLTLDPGYDLLCYVSHEYHGIWGRVAAVKKGAEREPILGRIKTLFGPEFKLPETAAPPLEAIYTDGTYEGYFDALVFDQLLNAIPYTRFERHQWDYFQFAPPEDILTEWDRYIDITDWSPRIISFSKDSCELLVYRMEFESGIGSSDGRSRIYLTQYHFKSRLRFYHGLQEMAGHDKMYPARIDDDSRYTEDRRCCVTSSQSVLAARVKAYRVSDYPHSFC